MEWVETTGRTLEEAKEAALDELGVAAEDAEFDVVEEPRSGLFGRVRQEARVRARVRPTSPRPKADRRDRRRKPAEGGAAAQEPSPARAEAPAATPSPGRARGGSRAPSAPVAVEDVADELAADVVGEGAAVVQAVGANPGRSPQRGGGRGRGTAPRDEVAANGAAARGRGADVDDEPSLDEQRETVVQFLDGLVDAFGATATVEVEEVDDETLEAKVIGDDLGLLIGPKGATLQAVQEITRTVVQRAAEPGRGARVRVDIGGYREHRREALGRFTRQIAEQVLGSGDAVALEPMSAPDRKVVHDTVNEIDGVVSSSEGDDPDRRVVISPG
jgi:spoIIIJ-associated protein